MTLTITQRLTLTCALLTALVVLLATAGLYFLMSKNVEADGEAAVRESVNRLAHQTVKQLDEDILVDFRGQAVGYHGLNVAHDHWAVMRGCGRVECATGAFESDLSPQLGPVAKEVRSNAGTWFRTASAAVVEDGGPKLEDLPEAVRKEAVSRCVDGMFLNAKSEISGNRNVVSVKFLKPDQILEVQVALDGRFIQKRSEGLPQGLPPDLLPAESGWGQLREGTLSWTAHEGQLLAVLPEAAVESVPIRRAANRLGECFELCIGMQVLRRLEGSRLYVVTALDISAELHKKNLAFWVLCLTGSLLWMLIALIGWYVTRRAMSPVDDIVHAVRRIEPSQMQTRLPVAEIDDELSRIAWTINGMLDRIEDGYRRERQFTADASHELRGPLTKNKAEIELALSQERSSDEYRMTLGRVRCYTEYMQRLVEALLLLARLDARREPLAKDRFDLAEACFEVVNTFPEEEVQRVALEICDSKSPIQVIAERRLIGVLLHNLVENALRYSPPAKPVRVRIRRHNGEAGVEVEDEGPGVNGAHAAQLFDRFYRLDKARTRESGGFGLGLSIAKAIADAHGLSVTLASAAKGGTVARFSLPLAT